MKQRRNLIGITVADFIVRTAYQIGKTPILPIFAARLGAPWTFLGFIVSVSTITGMVLKPAIGILSDRWGRYRWLIAGTVLFAGVPFLYRFVETPDGLFGIRVFHGLATAIYGPVTLAFVAEQTKTKRAEKLGWFGMARQAGYILGPVIGGWLLLTMDPVSVFNIIGLLSCLAFIPVFLLKKGGHTRSWIDRPTIRRQAAEALKAGIKTPSIWFSGGLESGLFVALYATKAFLPVYASSLGVNVALIGTFFAIQEGTHMVLKPMGGRLGDRFGYLGVIFIGMSFVGIALPLLALANGMFGLFMLAMLIGAGQAFVFPATIALVLTQISSAYTGAGMGLIGTLKNAGKVVGPILGGILIDRFDFNQMFQLMGVLLLLGAGLIWYWGQRGLSPVSVNVSVQE
ncbi:MAG: MFS transporter [Candidatus Poribacteria bacterium]|nr:MFS transporter [Candidatus Poribacteria bacterium]MDE0503342.1 MFS transporter [Candidatus Poribacteria bacterium]